MKYYTVGLYNVKYTDYYDGQQMYVEEVIVKKGLCYATELLTGKKSKYYQRDHIINLVC